MITGFPPIAATNAKILILGSVPGIASLEKQEYYGHPHNSFWNIIAQFADCPPLLTYEQKKAVLIENEIALWDVLKHCQREGSLDSSIESQSIVINDFELFFKEHPDIRFVLFNGTKAEKEYKKRVIPLIGPQFDHLTYYRLPSTSPAMAQLSKQEKLQKWLAVMNKIKEHFSG
jgi:TDG/mug DNA glycosylase family protein